MWLFKRIIFHFVIRCSFGRFITLIVTALRPWGPCRSISLVEAFENDIGKLVFFEGMIDFFQNTRGLSLDYADVMDTSRTDPYDSSMHQRFDKLRSMSDRLDSVVVC